MEAVGVGPRAVAVLIDSVLLCVVGYLIALATGGLTEQGFSLQGGPAFLWLAIALAYYIVMEAKSGATLGKRAMGLKAVKESGEPLDWQASVVRNVMRLVDGFFFYLVAAIAVWVSKSRQRLGDMAAHTIVVKARAFVPLVLALAFCGLNSPESLAGPPRYAETVLSDAKDGKDMRVFKPQTGKIYLQAKLVDVPSGSTVKSEWVAIKTGVAPPNYTIDSVVLNVGPRMNRVSFSLSRPNQGWPEGDCKVALSINDKPAGEVKFKVAQ